MLCKRCGKIFTPDAHGQFQLEAYRINGNLRRINCTYCNNFYALQLNNDLIDVNISEEKYDNKWKEVQSNRERIVYYILSQIIYPEYDTPKENNWESLYDYADANDKILLRWENGIAIGFYTIKLKGTQVLSTGEKYPMYVLDTAYVRSEYRSRGFGLEMIQDITNRFPDEDIGFSKPISKGMLRVLKNFLSNHKEFRFCFWEIADNDIENSQQLIWALIKRKSI